MAVANTPITTAVDASGNFRLTNVPRTRERVVQRAWPRGTGLNLNGIVSAFTGTATAFQFAVDGRLVKGDGQTEFFGNSRFSDLANGARVEVKGAQRDAFVYANRIKVN